MKYLEEMSWVSICMSFLAVMVSMFVGISWAERLLVAGWATAVLAFLLLKID